MMPVVKRPVTLEWTLHAQAKMRQYRLSPARVRRVLHAPRRVEEGIAPTTVAMMQPASMKTKDTWTQEIWVMFQETRGARRVISAWRYPGTTRPRSATSLGVLRAQYRDFMDDPDGR